MDFDPLQVYAALNILFIGYSRVYEGSHWLTDVAGSCLMGAFFHFIDHEFQAATSLHKRLDEDAE